MTTRMMSASSVIDSRPHTSGFSRMRERHLPVCDISVAVRSSSASTASTSTSYGTARSRMTRAQPCDMLPTRRISPLRTNHSVPFTSRTLVMRICTSSTMPVAGPRSTMSPTPTWSSTTMKRPLSTSFTMFCAPKPSPAPIAAVSSANEARTSGLIVLTMSSTTMMNSVTLTMFVSTEPERARALHEAHRGERRGRCLQRLRVGDVLLLLDARDDLLHDALDDEVQHPADQQGDRDDEDDRDEVAEHVVPVGHPVVDDARPEVAAHRGGLGEVGASELNMLRKSTEP